MKTLRSITIAAGFLLAAFWSGRVTRSCRPSAPESVRIDTVVVRDTLRDTVLVPTERLVARTDTVWMAGGTTADSVRVVVPIKRKVYETGDYRAVVEGFRPSLVEIDLYRRTRNITRETTATEIPPRRRSSGATPKWGVGIQAGYGFGPKGTAPYIGIGIQYSIIEW